MQLIQIRVPVRQRTAVLKELTEQNIDYVDVVGESDERSYSLVQFPVPTDAVEHVLDDLRDVGLDLNDYTIVTSVEFASTETTEELQTQYAGTPNRIAPQALRSKIRDLRRDRRAFLWMMVLSTVIATAGLMMGSPAVIVGAMVIAPIVSPALASSVGALMTDRESLVGGMVSQLLGLGVAILGATAFAFVLRQTFLVPSHLDVTSLDFVTVRLAPSFLSLVVALAAGAAAAYGLATKESVSIIGVMIAAALVPSAATAGIGIAWNLPTLAVGAAVLLVLNMLSINLAGYVMLRYLDYRSEPDRSAFWSHESRREVVISVLVVLVVLASFATVGALTYNQIVFERAVNSGISDTLDRPAYDSLRVQSVHIRFQSVEPMSTTPSITVALARTSDQRYPDLPDALGDEVSRGTGRNVAIQVRYIDYASSSTG